MAIPLAQRAIFVLVFSIAIEEANALWLLVLAVQLGICLWNVLGSPFILGLTWALMNPFPATFGTFRTCSLAGVGSVPFKFSSSVLLSCRLFGLYFLIALFCSERSFFTAFF